MKTVKTSELTGAALDWAVAKCEHPEWSAEDAEMNVIKYHYKWSASWAQGGPIIEREKITVCFDTCRPRWVGCDWDARLTEFGETPLIAAMRCYVASKLGDKVELPEGLTND